MNSQSNCLTVVCIRPVSHFLFFCLLFLLFLLFLSAQLKPGVVTVHGNDIADITHRLFVSGGFACIKADSSAEVTAVEAVRLEDLDSTLVRKGQCTHTIIIAHTNR